MVAIGDPFLLLGDCQPSEILVTPDRPWRDVEDASENAGDFEPQETKGHVCKTLALFHKFSHAWLQIGIVDIERLACVSRGEDTDISYQLTILVSNWASTIVGSQP
jgi:hypothetical protein